MKQMIFKDPGVELMFSELPRQFQGGISIVMNDTALVLSNDQLESLVDFLAESLM